jgi:transketolase
VIGTGPVLANVLTLPQGELVRDLDIWCVGVFPIRDLPEELVSSVRTTKKVLTIEEHYGQCGLNEAVARLLLDRVESPTLYTALSAAGYPSGTYGSQQWHQQESGLAGEPLAERLRRTFYV